LNNIYLTIFILFISQAIGAEVLKDVIVIGNKRTTKSAIIQHGQIKIGSDLTNEGVNTIKEHLGRINQITLKNIDFTDGILTVEIMDKWTLFPVPMITESGNYHNRGLILYEDNFLGTLGTLAPGVSWSNSVFNALLYYQDESLFSPATGIKVLLMRKSDYVEFKRRDIVNNIHESRYDLVMITPNYLYKENVFKAGPVYINKKIYDDAGGEIFRDKSKGIFFRHHLNAFQAMDVMYEGVVTTYDLYSLRSESHKWIFRHEFDVKWSIPTAKNFINLGLHGHHVNDSSFLFPKYLGGDDGFRGYDKSSLPASKNIGAMMMYQQHLYKNVFLSPFY